MENFIRNNYPSAREGKQVTRKCIQELSTVHGFDLDHTIMATSVCSDEIVRSTTNFREYLGHQNPFALGGLAGYPFVGQTGFKAFASHVPDHGFILILYGSHIGISRNGEVGVMQRRGQMLESSCCGALQASLKSLELGTEPEADADYDYQQWKIETEVHEERDRILKGSIPLVQATEVMFSAIDRRIRELLERTRDDFRGRKVALVGGIIINTDLDLPDWFDLRHFEVLGF